MVRVPASKALRLGTALAAVLGVSISFGLNQTVADPLGPAVPLVIVPIDTAPAAQAAQAPVTQAPAAQAPAAQAPAAQTPPTQAQAPAPVPPLATASQAASAGVEEVVAIALDQARMMKVPERVATVVIGNPLIADATLQAGNVMVVTGKGYGATNIAVLDRAGAVLMERMVEVVGPPDRTLIVYRGIARETYSCTPSCEPRLTLGDARTYFDPTLQQIGARAGQAMAASAAAR